MKYRRNALMTLVVDGGSLCFPIWTCFAISTDPMAALTLIPTTSRPDYGNDNQLDVRAAGADASRKTGIDQTEGLGGRSAGNGG